MNDDLTLLQLNWSNAEQYAKPIRSEVFIKEQQVDPSEEWDDDDHSAIHLIVIKQDQAIATARLTQQGKIGRMSVLKAYRQQGIGSKMLSQLVQLAQQQQMNTITLWAQTHAKTFYRKHGFVEQGGEFLDAGIPHIKMILDTNTL